MFCILSRCKNGIAEHSDYTKDADVTDVAGGTRHHRKNMLAALPLDEDKYADYASNPPKDSTTRSTRSSRLRGSARGAVDYNEEKVCISYFLPLLVHWGYNHISCPTVTLIIQIIIFTRLV